jgi:hypothetical protein
MGHPENQQHRFGRWGKVHHKPQKHSQRRPPEGGRYKCNAKPDTTADRSVPMSFAFEFVVEFAFDFVFDLALDFAFDLAFESVAAAFRRARFRPKQDVQTA